MSDTKVRKKTEGVTVKKFSPSKYSGGRSKGSGAHRAGGRNPAGSSASFHPGEAHKKDDPIAAPRATMEDLQKADERRRSLGEELARKIFELANKQRVQDIDAYVKVINSVVLDKQSADNQAILETARTHFRQEYGQWCRERGKSPEMLDNIVHRTGRASYETIAKVIRGFDVKDISRRLWQLHFEQKQTELLSARRELYELTNGQVRELRDEYASIPAQELAREIHQALSSSSEGLPPDKDAVSYVLLGRSAEEIRAVETQYNEHYHFDGPKEAPLRTRLKEAFPPEEAAEIEELMNGFDQDVLAAKLHSVLVHCSELGEALENSAELAKDLAAKVRLYHGDDPVWERELRAREHIESLTCHLSSQQFQAAAEALARQFGETLTPALYSCNRAFDPRRTALDLAASLSAVDPRRSCSREQDYISYQNMLEIRAQFSRTSGTDISDLISVCAAKQKTLESRAAVKKALLPLEFLTPAQLREVKTLFHILHGRTVEEVLAERIPALCQGEVPPCVKQLVQNRLNGISRLPLQADLFALFATSEQRRRNHSEMQPQEKEQEEARRDAHELAGPAAS